MKQRLDSDHENRLLKKLGSKDVISAATI